MRSLASEEAAKIRAAMDPLIAWMIENQRSGGWDQKPSGWTEWRDVHAIAFNAKSAVNRLRRACRLLERELVLSRMAR